MKLGVTRMETNDIPSELKTIEIGRDVAGPLVDAFYATFFGRLAGKSAAANPEGYCFCWDFRKGLVVTAHSSCN